MELIKKLFHKMGKHAAMNLTLEDLAILSTSYNGYEREKAIALLDELKDPRALPLLLERLNDWVPAVKLRAETALFSLLVSSNAAYYVRLLPDFFHLKKRRRYDHNLLIEKIIIFLLREENRIHLINSIMAKNQKLAFIALRLCLQHKLLPIASLISLALKSKNIASIKDALPLIDQLSDKEFENLLNELIQQKFTPIIVKTIRRLESVSPGMITEIAAPLIFSKNQELRKLGRLHLALADIDAVIIYGNALVDPKSSLSKVNIALIESVELLKLDAMNILRDHTKHHSANIRRTALQQIAKLLGDEAKSFLWEGLLDEYSTVKNESARLCIKCGVNFTPKELIGLYEQQSNQFLLNPILRLAKKNGKWPRLSVLLHILPKFPGNPEGLKQINSEIHQWNHSYNAGSAQPSNEDIAELEHLAVKNSTLITTENWKLLQFTFDTLVR